ncbi:MAG TPA: hypothetical protein VIE40_05170 [Dehalococcoidia bacterium]
MDATPESPFPRLIPEPDSAGRYRLRAALLELTPAAATALAASTFALEEHLVSAPAHVGEALGFAFLSLCWWPSGIGWFLIGRPLQGGVSAIVRWASVVTLFAFALDLLSYIDCGRECHPDLRPLIGAFIVVCVWPLASAACLTVTLIADALFPRISDD